MSMGHEIPPRAKPDNANVEGAGSFRSDRSAGATVATVVERWQKLRAIEKLHAVDHVTMD